MMPIEHGVLRYLGVDTLLPNREFTGAAPSDFFAGAWALKGSGQDAMTRVGSKSIVEDIAAEGVESNAPFEKVIDVVINKERMPERSTDHLKIQKNNVTEVSEADVELTQQKSIDQPNNFDTQAINLSESTGNIYLHVFQHPELNILVLAELEDGRRNQQEDTFLKKILRSFSQGQASQWKYEQFSWPPKQQRLSYLKVNQDAGREVLRGYLESKQSHQPAFFICFENGGISNFLSLADKPSVDDFYEIKNLTGVWNDSKVFIFPGLASLMKNPEEKDKLWSFIKLKLLK